MQENRQNLISSNKLQVTYIYHTTALSNQVVEPVQVDSLLADDWNSCYRSSAVRHEGEEAFKKDTTIVLRAHVGNLVKNAAAAR